MNYIVISDLHIGGGPNLDIFHSQAQLSNFLKSLGDAPLTLNINGDFIDFLAVPFTGDPAAQFNRDFTFARPTTPGGGHGVRVSLEAWRDGRSQPVVPVEKVMP